MATDIFWDLAGKVGLPFALVVLALLTGRAGIWVWGREIEYERKQHLERVAELTHQAEQREGELRRDRDYYRDISFEALNRAEGAVARVEQVVEAVERHGPRRHP